MAKKNLTWLKNILYYLSLSLITIFIVQRFVAWAYKPIVFGVVEAIPWFLAYIIVFAGFDWIAKYVAHSKEKFQWSFLLRYLILSVVTVLASVHIRDFSYSLYDAGIGNYNWLAMIVAPVLFALLLFVIDYLYGKTGLKMPSYVP